MSMSFSIQSFTDRCVTGHNEMRARTAEFPGDDQRSPWVSFYIEDRHNCDSFNLMTDNPELLIEIGREAYRAANLLRIANAGNEAAKAARQKLEKENAATAEAVS